MTHNGKSLVIDSGCLFAKSFYAALSSPSLKYLDDGYLVAVLKSLFTTIHLEIGRPERILFCFDGKPKTNKPRPPKPRSYYESLAHFKEFVQEAFGPEAYALHPDHEADDLVATVVTRIAAQGGQAIVMSGDKDLQQLRSGTEHGSIEYYCLNRKHLLTVKDVCERWGVHHPIQVAVALALIGDAGDGINGVDRCGAGWVAKKFAKIEPDTELLSVVDQVATSLTEAQQAQFYESLDFTLLNTQVPCEQEPVPLELNSDPRSVKDGPALDEWFRGVQLLNPEATARAVEEWNP